MTEKHFHLRISINEVERVDAKTDRTREVTNVTQYGTDLATLIELAKDHLHLVQQWCDRQGRPDK